MAETADDGREEDAWLSPIFGDIVAKMTLGVDLAVAHRFRLGLPVIVDRGNGIEELTA